MTNKWTTDQVNILKTLWRENKTAREIMKYFDGKTRNAIIGKANRLGLSKPLYVVDKKSAPRPATLLIPEEKPYKSLEQRKNEPPKPSGAPRRNPKPYVPSSERREINETAYGEAKTLLDLGAKECRWPVGDLFCAGEISKGSYCAAHNRIK